MNIKDLFSKLELFVELADTPFKRQQGLMFRNELDEDSGMLFTFKYPQKLSFWGLNTFIPLDIAFIDKKGVIRDINHIDPMSKKSVSCNAPCKYALEVNYNYFKKNNIEIGDKIKINNSGLLTRIEFEKNEE